MTRDEAIRALLDEYGLPEFAEMFRDEAKQDETWEGPSWEHPRVQRFNEICRTLRAAVGGETHGEANSTEAGQEGSAP